jgi:hypothetical protein
VSEILSETKRALWGGGLLWGGGQAASLGRLYSRIVIADACPFWGRDLKSIRR